MSSDWNRSSKLSPSVFLLPLDKGSSSGSSGSISSRLISKLPISVVFIDKSSNIDPGGGGGGASIASAGCVVAGAGGGLSTGGVAGVS